MWQGLNGLIAWLEAHPLPAIAIVGSVFGVIATGILQELANHVVDKAVVPWLGVVADVPRWILVVLIVTLLGLAITVWQQSLQITRFRARADEQSPAAVHKRMKAAEGQRMLVANYLITSVDVFSALIVYLADIAWPGDLAHVKKLLIKIVLRRVQLMYPPQEVPYASVYVPSGEDPDYLTIFENINVHPDRVKRNRWYIGTDIKLRKLRGGTAGKAYITGKPIVRHIDPSTHKAKAGEGADYIPSRQPGDVALYVSFVAIPIKDDGKSLGVLCLDSSVTDTFDGDAKQSELEPAVKLLAQILQIRKQTADKH